MHQSNIFGSGNSFVKSSCLQDVEFSKEFEFCYGEDADFGMQLRKKGIDIVYFPEYIIKHLKAPKGGFRTKPILLWNDDLIVPKPSPTIMLFNLKYKTIEQMRGYKTILFFKYYKIQKIKNPITYLMKFNKQWKRSLFWANELIKINSHEI
jgi:GT2 family glycosyltransferase